MTRRNSRIQSKITKCPWSLTSKRFEGFTEHTFIQLLLCRPVPGLCGPRKFTAEQNTENIALFFLTTQFQRQDACNMHYVLEKKQIKVTTGAFIMFIPHALIPIAHQLTHSTFLSNLIFFHYLIYQFSDNLRRVNLTFSHLQQVHFPFQRNHRQTFSQLKYVS